MSPKSPPKHKERRAKRWSQVKLLLKSFKPFAWPGVVAVFLLSPLLLPWFLEVTVWEHRSVKISGVLFQLAGVGSVVLGLSRSREMFGERGLWRWVRHLTSQVRRILFPPKYVHLDVQDVEARAHPDKIKLSVPESREKWTLEDRVAAMENDLQQINQEIGDVKKTAAKNKSALENAMKAEETERSKSDRELRYQIKEAIIGGIHLEAAGVFFIAIGIVLATFPGGIAGLLY